MIADMRRAFYAVVRGAVQGVAFRYYARLRATELGLTGYVRNLPDGSVELLAEGEEAALAELERWLGHGPPSAEVGEVVVTAARPRGEYRSFVIAG
jgi:acylphosphatase